MNLIALRNHCLAKPGVTEERPFGPETLVFKVMGKMFALTGDEPQPRSINLKADPDEALALRAEFEGVLPGYHMNKKHWNTVLLQADVPEVSICEMIDDSYFLVVNRLPKADRAAIVRQLDQKN